MALTVDKPHQSHGEGSEAATAAAQAATAHPRSMPPRRASRIDFGLPLYCKSYASLSCCVFVH